MEPEYPIVTVRWVDATDRIQESIKDINRTAPLSTHYGEARTAIGWLIKEDETGIVLSHDICDDEDADISFIPKTMLTSIKKVNVK